MSSCNTATRNYIRMVLLFQALAKCSKKGECNADHLLCGRCLACLRKYVTSTTTVIKGDVQEL